MRCRASWHRENACSIWRRLEGVGEWQVAAVESQDNGRLMCLVSAGEPRQYIIGVDSAGGGTEGDYACAQVIERENRGCSARSCMGIFLRRNWRSGW